MSLLNQILLQKNLYSKQLPFLEFLLSGGQTVDLRSNLRTYWRSTVTRAIKCAFAGRCSSSGSRVMCQFVEKCWKRQNLTLLDLWWPDLWPDLKNDRTSFVMIFGTLSNSPPAARGVRRRAAARCVFNDSILYYFRKCWHSLRATLDKHAIWKLQGIAGSWGICKKFIGIHVCMYIHMYVQHGTASFMSLAA